MFCGFSHNGLALGFGGEAKGMAHYPGTKELIEWLGNISRPIIVFMAMTAT